MPFQEIIQEDLDNIFFDETEFAEVIEYNGEKIPAIETDISEFQTYIPGFVLPTKTILVKESDVEKPKAGDVVIMNEIMYHVGQGSRQDSKGVWIIPVSRRITNAGA